MKTICSVVYELVEKDPAREFWTFRDLDTQTDHRLTYGDLWRSAAGFAEQISGISKHPRALIVLPIGADILACHLGTLLSGGIPVIHSHPSGKMREEAYIQHLRNVLRTTSPDLVITNRLFQGTLQPVIADLPTPVLAIDDSLKETKFQPTAWQSVNDDDLAVIQYTSGSTGLQKGVGLTHRMIMQQCESLARTLELDPATDRICSWIPLYHDMGLFATWLLPLLKSVRVAAIDPFLWARSPASFLQLITDFQGTLCWQPNFAYNLLASRLQDKDLEGLNLSSMRGFVNCSEPARAASHKIFLEKFKCLGVTAKKLWVCYAMAENAFAVSNAGHSNTDVTVLRCEPDNFSRGKIEPVVTDSAGVVEVVSAGSTIPGCSVRVVDSDRAELPDDRIGEIALKSPFTIREYFQNPAATEAAIDSDGWYYTGDLGFRQQDRLFITGRKKDILIVAGRNFYPQDIESIVDTCLHAVPGRSVAIGVDDELSGTQRIVILAESRSSSAKHHEELKADIRKRAFEQLDCPIQDVFVVPYQWLHKTSSGKIARNPNLERYRSEGAGFPAIIQPAEPVYPLWETLGWGALIALAVFLILILQPNWSWGIYAGF
ncbi:MAG: AMP-binding protein [Candidatus Riflebacteria bacterium]|nr:AMP-binding protein [Candidatus Riflebacteria bacterium]